MAILVCVGSLKRNWRKRVSGFLETVRVVLIPLASILLEFKVSDT